MKRNPKPTPVLSWHPDRDRSRSEYATVEIRVRLAPAWGGAPEGDAEPYTTGGTLTVRAQRGGGSEAHFRTPYGFSVGIEADGSAEAAELLPLMRRIETGWRSLEASAGAPVSLAAVVRRVASILGESRIYARRKGDDTWSRLTAHSVDDIAYRVTEDEQAWEARVYPSRAAGG